MMRVVAATVAGALLASLGNAPMQCGHGGGAEGGHAEEPGDALYALAQDFHARGNEEASRQTLQFLIQKYPSNRHAPAARAEIESGHVSETDGRAERGGPANDAGPPNEVRDGRESRTDAGK